MNISTSILLDTKAEKVCTVTGAQINRPITYQNSNTNYSIMTQKYN